MMPIPGSIDGNKVYFSLSTGVGVTVALIIPLLSRSMVMFFRLEKQIIFTLFSIASALSILLLAACGNEAADTPTAVPIPVSGPVRVSSPTPGNTIYPLVTATAHSNLTDSAQAGAFIRQDFSAGLTGWDYFYQGSPEIPKDPAYDLVDGRLIFNIDTVNTGLYLIYQERSFVDVQIAVRSENVGTRSSVSLVCGYTDNGGWYEFNITSQGLYSLRSYEDEEVGTIIKEGGSQSIRVGQGVNDYSIACRASRSMSLNINGKDIIEVQDFLVPVGRAGVAVWVSDRHPIRVEIDQVTLTDLQ